MYFESPSFFSFGFQSHFSCSFRHSMPSSFFSLAFRAIVHCPFRHLESLSFCVLTFRVIPPQLYHSESQSLVFISTSIAHIAFMASHLLSLFSPRYPVLISYSSLFFQFPSSLLMTMSFEFTIRISVMLLSTLHLSFSYSSFKIVSSWHFLSCTSEWFDRYSSLIWSFESLLETS